MKTFKKTIAKIVGLSTLILTMNSALADEQKQLLKVDESTFTCINDMSPVRDFFVDNLNKKNLDKTLAVAKAGQGEYPEGSIVQLVPTEVMVKHAKGTNPTTNDWEFFELAVSKEGNTFTTRGFDNVKNKFGGNCLDCHKKARPEFDMICETGHGCDPIPITKEMIKVIQKTDPRCTAPVDLDEREIAILGQLKAMLGG
ncbi:hypothetical protein ACFSJY_10420 [Thalassotalea euphylliae]|uniref:hypothetical protein n=1 Tax=Thalassotalea euphylliae TaxID=1655234 RepID=UPI0036250025